MIIPSAPNIICGEAFDKLREVLNTVHHVKCTKWGLRIPTVLWACRTMCKTLTVQELLKLKYAAGDIISLEHAKPSLCISRPIDMTVCEGFTCHEKHNTYDLRKKSDGETLDFANLKKEGYD